MAYNGWNLLGGFRLLGDNLADLARWSNPHSYLQSINLVVPKEAAFSSKTTCLYVKHQ